MNQENALEILKQAILLEKRGRAFYETVSEQTNNADVKQFFEMMAQEEDHHVEILAAQYKSFQESGEFSAEISRNAAKDGGGSVASDVLGQAIREKLSAAGYESAAIAAAIAMEERALKLYGDRAVSADDPAEKSLYEWLSGWERGHLNALLEMDRQLTEKIWNDNQFWPF